MQEGSLPFDSLWLVRQFPLLGLAGESEGTFLAMEIARVTLVDHLVHGAPALSAETSVAAGSIPYAGKGCGDGGWGEGWGRSAEIRGIARGLNDNGRHAETV